jgi:hypothetical protein
MDAELALRYFDELNPKLKLHQGVLKVVSGIEQNTKVIVKYQPEANSYPCYN